MLRKIIVVCLVLAVVVPGGIYLFVHDQPKRLAAAIEQRAGESLGVAVRVGGVEIANEGADAVARLTRVTIANPPGFAESHAVVIETLVIRYDGSADAARVVVREIVADGVSVNYEGRARESNLELLQRNAQAVQRARTAQRAEDPLRLIVDSFALRPARLSVRHEVLGAQPLAATMPPVVAGGIGRRENGVGALEVGQRLIGALAAEATRSALGEVQKSLQQRPR